MRVTVLIPGLVLGVALSVTAGLAVPFGMTAAQDSDLLCATDDSAPTTVADGSDPLAGRLDGTREAFEARFGPPAEEGPATTWRLAGCGDIIVSFDEGPVDEIPVFSEGFEVDQSQWTLNEAQHVASDLLPRGVATRQRGSRAGFHGPVAY